MVISASRRTDIPAFYSKWFCNRIRAGYCLTQNPFNKKQFSRIDLSQESVDAIVFWTKNPKQLLSRLDLLDEMNYKYYFQFTLNNYPFYLEPKLPKIEDRIYTFKKLSQKIGDKRVIWRYDPIIISTMTNWSFHSDTFKDLCSELGPYTTRVVISIVDYYKKTKRNLEALEIENLKFDYQAENDPQMINLLLSLVNTAKKYNLEIFTCGEKNDFSNIGIYPGCCIDGQLIEELWGVHKPWKKDPGQREACGCVISKDIGAPDTCIHNCPYCYANVSAHAAQKRFQLHNPDSPTLVGWPPENVIEPQKQQKLF